MDDNALRLKIKLEALISEREGMLAANKARERRDESAEYGPESFFGNQNSMLELLHEFAA